jgi:nicotinate phosphoribosyltransferase
VYDQRGRATADVLALADEDLGGAGDLFLRHPSQATAHRVIPRAEITRMEELHELVWQDGRVVGEAATIEQMRERRRQDIELLDVGVRRIVNPHIYHVSLTQGLWDLKQRIIRQMLG